MPILIALAPQERVALIGHALGGFAPDIARTRRLTELGRAFWRGLGHAVRPMPVAAGTPPAHLPALWLVWQFVGVLVWAPIWAVHLAVSCLDARAERERGLRADLAAMRASGTVGMLGALNELALWPYYAAMVNGTAPAGRALAVWRRRIQSVRATRPADLNDLRQLSNRLDASIFARCLPIGRRYDVLAAAPYQAPRVVVSADQAARIDAELAPYAELLRQRLAEAYELQSTSPGGGPLAGADEVMWSVAPWLSLLNRSRPARATRP